MAESKMPMYKGKPLVRSGNTVYYGHPAEKYVAMLQILGTSGEVAGVPISDRVLVQILSTDESLPPMQRIIKKAEKKGIYQALNIASIWLERSLKEA